MNDKKTILCVDDEVDIVELFKEEFEQRGYNFHSAYNVKSALEVFEKHEVDCIVSDIRMPEADGIELIRSVKEENQKIPIFIVTGFSDYKSEDVSSLDINAVIFKPFDLDEVVEMVTRSVEKVEI